ncbi:MAG: dipeptidase [Verrucomicrobiae bacterium]|nr:dipeptidase [Verrucomicrobiae bacterium]
MDAVLNYLEQHQKRFVAELAEYVRFASVSAQTAHNGDMSRCATWLVKHCQQIGLRARLCPTAGHPVVLASTPPVSRRRGQPSRRHFMVYGHYDVQPPEPFELWQTPPFEPVVRNGALFGRGASDNKGQHFAHLKAVEAFLKTGQPLPVDLTFVIEGEEEVGSRSLEAFLKAHRSLLSRCDGVVVSDTGMPGPRHPALTYALRGIVGLEIIVHGPSRDLHSGIFGGSVENPAMALCQLLAKVRDAQGRITIPGFYDPVLPLSKFEREQLARVPFDAERYRRFLGVPRLFGECGFTPNEQRTARPTFEINGLTSGYQGEGSKTIVPAWARAKITARLVPRQRPERVLKKICAFLKKHCPPTVRLEIRNGHGSDAYYVSPRSADAQAALRALREAFEAEPLLLREGGSIPIVHQFKKVLGLDTLLVGLALPDDNAHSPNEKFDLDVFARGQRMSALLWRELANGRRS